MKNAEIADKLDTCPEVISHWVGRYKKEGILNVNIPGCKLSECNGILRNRTVSRSMFFTDRYRKITDLPKDGVRLEVDGQYGEVAEEGTDMRAVIDRYISIGFVERIS